LYALTSLNGSLQTGQRMQMGDTSAIGLLEEVPKVTLGFSAVAGFHVEEDGEEFQPDPFPLPDMLTQMLVLKLMIVR
jgi:hypothetical protein